MEEREPIMFSISFKDKSEKSDTIQIVFLFIDLHFVFLFRLHS